MKIVSFDIGHTNLAMVVANVEIDENTCEVLEIIPTHTQMINLAHIQCNGDCVFSRNDNCAAHKCHHFVDSIHEHLVDSDLVLAERQPLCGLTGIEQSLYIYIKQRYSGNRKDHMRLISPNSVHAHFNMSSEKTQRRIQVVEIVFHYLKNSSVFMGAKEKDHLADAFIFVLFYCQTNLQRENVAKKVNPFDKLRYISKN